jgi:RNA polymerase sigma factor (sigma-70 family)
LEDDLGQGDRYQGSIGRRNQYERRFPTEGLMDMANGVTSSVVRQIESLFGGGSVAGLSDRQLLERFIAGRGSLAAEAAFAAIIARHGPMVLRVCCQILGDHQHAEDAFQAVFLVLARRARSLRDPELLSHWLYGVAFRTARKARTRLLRTRKREGGAGMQPLETCAAAPAPAPAEQSAINCEQAGILHEEIDRLPASARLPIVLCYFEGLSTAEAALRLRCPAGTVHSRLIRARETLRHRLVRRGVMLSGVALAAALEPRFAAASVSSLLCAVTTKAAVQLAAGQAVRQIGSASAASLAQEMLRSMLFSKLRFGALVLLTLGTVITGVGYLSRILPKEEEPAKSAAVWPVRVAAKPTAPPGGQPGPAAKPEKKPMPGRMTVTGRVLDAAGKPAARVPVDILGRPRAAWVASMEEVNPRVVLGHGVTDGSGRLRLDAMRSSADGFFKVDAVAAVAGSGLGWAQLKPDAD